MTELLLSRSSDPVGLQVLVGIVSALLFYLLYYLFSGRKHNNEEQSVLSKVNEKEDNENKRTSSKKTSSQQVDSQEDIIRRFLRSKFDSVGKSILLTSNQNLPKREQYVNNSMKLDNYFIHDLVKEPGYDEIVKIANENGIDLNKIKQDEFKRAIEKYTDPLDYL